MTVQIVMLAGLLLLSGFFSSAETALFSISRAKARHISKLSGRGNALIHRMKQDPHRLLSTILIGNNLVNVAASAMATSLTMSLIPNRAVSIATGVMTFLILVFGEIIPKSMATRNNLLISRLVIFPIYWFSILFFPVIKFLDFIPKLTGKIKKTPSATEEELLTFVEVVEEEGEIKVEERELIHKIFEFDDTNTSEIMTPRADMFVVDATLELPVDLIIESGFTRIPVIEEDIDHVIGILNVKDLFKHLAVSNSLPNVRNVMQPPYFVPENKKLDSLLHLFKKRKQHMAIVVDEHGGVSGLITLEDLLEELVGEIVDETDKDEPHIVPVQPNEWIVPGKSDIDEVNARIPLNIPDSSDYDTFSGYVLTLIERIPDEKERITHGDFCITVLQKDGNRITAYRVNRLEGEAGQQCADNPAGQTV